MRILVLIHEFPPIGGGGGQLVESVARLLVQRGHQVRVIAPHLMGLPFASSLDGISVWRIPSFRRHPYRADFLAMAGYLLVGFFAGLWEIWRFRPHLIHVHFAVPAGALAWVLHKLTGIPYVLTSHLGDVPGGVPEKTQRWFRWIMPFTPRIWKDADRVTAISKYTRQLALQHYPVEIAVIHNGFGGYDVSEAQVEVNTPPQIIFAGRFAPQKNPEIIPLILSEIRDLPWRCVMIGDGPLRPETEKRVRTLGLADRIDFRGWRSQTQVAGELLQSDILLLPSRSEGIPMIGLESLAAGLVIVAGGRGGVVDLIEHEKNGLYCATGEIRDYAAALRAFLSQPDKLLQARLRSLEKSHEFDLQKVVDEYESVLQGVVRQSRYRVREKEPI